MADYQNLTSLAGLSVGDVVTYNRDMLIDFSIYKVRIELHGKHGTEYSSSDVKYGGIGGLTTFLFTPMRSGLTEYYFSGNGGVSLCASTKYDPYTRIAVAGDGGYGYLVNVNIGEKSYGGKGGGETGGTSYQGPSGGQLSDSYGGQQTKGGSGPGGTGGFGVGYTSSSLYRGGAGWYDGGKGAEKIYWCVGQGGGSGFVIGHTTDTYPTGYLDSDTTNKISLAIDEYQLTQGGSSITTEFNYKMVVTIIGLGYNHETQALLSFDTNGGYPIDSMIVDKGSSFEMVIPTREPTNKYQVCKFVRWYKDGAPFEEGTLIEEDMTLRASWLIKQIGGLNPYYKKEQTLQNAKTYKVVKTHKYVPGGYVDIETTRYPYTGQSQTVTLDPGLYRLRCWGAQGGSYNNTYQGGAGGYSEGVIRLEEPTTLYLYAGGQSSTFTSSTVSNAGFNGAGKGDYTYYNSTYTYAQGGGGGTDIRIGSDSLYARVIVAGGGAGASNSYNALTTRYGGGLEGGAYDSTYQATQTSGNAFGIGQNGYSANTYKYTSAGSGGGWYGGKSEQSQSDSNNYSSYTSGGSGYVYTEETASNYPSGCLLNSGYYLLEAQTIAGNMSIPDPNNLSQTTTGRLGNGYITISKVEERPEGWIDEITLEPIDLFYGSEKEEL